MPLTDSACRNAAATDKPRKLADAGGLYLLVKPGGKYWRWDYRHAGQRRTMALGVYPEVKLTAARAAHAKARAVLAEGIDPMARRTATKRQARDEAGSTFEGLARDWHRMKSAKWAQVTADKALTQMEQHLFPRLGHKPVTGITAPELLMVLRRVESAGTPYTATRLREICGQVFRFGIATGRAMSNPAGDLRGALETPTATHRPALTTRRDFGAFLRDLAGFKAADPMTLLATRLALLTFVRSQELRGARWDEIDIEAREWRIPAGRMKMAKGSNQAHVVPLSPQALEVLETLRALTGGEGLLLPNVNGADDSMSENTIGRMLWRLGYKGRQTLHGFRASARSLLSERGWSVAALERQLDHAERSKVVAAYARAEHLAERRQIMDDWGALVAEMESGSNVVTLGARAA